MSIRFVTMAVLFVLFVWFVIMLGFYSIASAHLWYTTDDITIAWNAPEKLTNGDPVPEGDDVRYRVYTLRHSSNSTKYSPKEITTDPIQTGFKYIKFEEEGRYYIGVKAIRFSDSDGDGDLEKVSEGSIAWSHDPENVLKVIRISPYCYSIQGTFGVEYFEPVGEPKFMRKLIKNYYPVEESIHLKQKR